MTYGQPYKGSKTKLAERIIDLMPRAEHLYDLFAGGCSIAHCALIKGKYGHVHINDINPMMPQAFVKALGQPDKYEALLSDLDARVERVKQRRREENG